MSTLSRAASSTSKNVSAKLLGSTRTMAGGKEIRFGVEGRAAMLRGVDLMADAVQVRDSDCILLIKGCRSVEDFVLFHLRCSEIERVQHVLNYLLPRSCNCNDTSLY